MGSENEKKSRVSSKVFKLSTFPARQQGAQTLKSTRRHQHSAFHISISEAHPPPALCRKQSTGRAAHCLPDRAKERTSRARASVLQLALPGWAAPKGASWRAHRGGGGRGRARTWRRECALSNARARTAPALDGPAAKTPTNSRVIL